MKKITSLFLFTVLLNSLFSQTEVITGWTFDDLQAADQTLKIIPSNLGSTIGSANIYLDGTNSSSDFLCVAVDPELTAFGGTTLNDPRSTPEAGNALTLANNSANGKSIIFKFSMDGYQNAFLTFATRGTATGFSAHQWAWSIDGTNFTNVGDNTANTTSTFVSDTLILSSIPALNNASMVYLKLTIDGASSVAGNNRIDNVLIYAEPFYDLEVLEITSPLSAICGSINNNVSVKIKNHSSNSVNNLPVYALVTFPDQTSVLLQNQLSVILADAETTHTIGTTNTLTPGTYHVKAFTVYPEDSNLNNDTLNYSFVIANIHEIPFLASLNDVSEDSFWNLDGFSFANASTQGNASRILSAELNSGNQTASFEIINNIDTLTFHNHLIVDYRFVNPVTFDTYSLVSGDSLNVFLSTDCGTNFTKIKTIDSANFINTSNFYHLALPLNAYSGKKILVKFEAKTQTGNFILQVDQIEVRNGDLWDMGAITKVLPVNTPCGSLNDTIRAIYKNTGDGYLNNVPISVQISRPYSPYFVTYNDTIRQSIVPGQEVLFTFTPTINTTVAGKYTFMIRAGLPYDTVATLGHNINNILIDSIRTIAALAVPFYEGFASTSYLNNWTTGASYDATNHYLYKTFSVGNTTETLSSSRRIGPITSSHHLFFDYTFTQNDGTAIPMGANDSIVLMISSDCGSSFTPIHTINTLNHTTSSTLANVQLLLTGFVGQNIIIKFQMTSNTANSKIILDEIIIDGAPQINIVGDTLVTVCEGTPHTITANGAVYYGYEWINTNDPGTVIGTTQTLDVSESGYYKVIASNNVGMTSSDSVHIVFQPLPVVTFELPSESTSLCPNGSFILLTGHNPTGGTFSGTGVSVNRFYPQTAGIGQHIITYSATQNGCSNSATDTIVVNPLSTVSLSGLPDVCLNDSPVTLNQGSPTGGTYNGIGVSGNEFNPQTAGVNTHIITYSIIDQYLCTYSSSDTLIVKPLPNAFAGNNTSICKGNQTTLVASGGAYYHWSTNEDNNSIIVAPTQTTIYIVTVTGLNGCTKVDDVNVSVNEYPVATLDLPYDTVCLQTTAFQLNGGSGTPAGGTSSYSGPGVSGAWFNPAIGLGTYIIRYTYSLNGCDSSVTRPITVENCTSVDEYDPSLIFSLSPNPVVDKLNLQINEISDIITIYITDLAGKIIFEQNITSSNTSKVEIQTSSWNSGAYLIHVVLNQRRYTQKVIKI